MRLPLTAKLIAAVLLSQAAVAATIDLASVPGQQDLWRVELNFDQPEFETVEINGLQFLQCLSLDEGFVGRPGAPDLPAISRLFEMPDDSGMQLRFVEGDSRIVNDVDAWPCQDRVSQADEFPLPFLQDETIYSSNDWWPGSLVELDDPALMRNMRVGKASFFPVQVNPVEHSARIWSRMVFELSYDGTNDVNRREFAIDAARSPLSHSLSQGVLNTVGQATPDRDTWFDEGQYPGKYLVFANSTAQANSYFQSLMDWKRQKGHEVVLVSDSEVSFTSSTAIRTRILNEYQGPGSVDYVLLVGDVDGSFGIATGGGQYDHYYAMIDGGDILGDVAVGRLSVDTATQLATVCDKIMYYEKYPTAAGTAWLQNAGFTVGSSVCGMSMITLSRAISGELVQDRGYTNIDSAYCAGSTHVTDWYNEGISFYNYRGWVGMEGLSTSDVLSLSQGPRTPVSTIFTCGTGDFNSGDDFTEAFLMAGSPGNPGGAVACMGFATLSTHTRYNNVLCGGYYGALLEHDVPEVGACLLQGKYELYATLPASEQSSAANFANWGNLMGDPGTVQWAGAPFSLSMAVPASLTPSDDHLLLTCMSGANPVAGIRVCAWQDQATDLQVLGITDASGQVLLSLDGLAAGTLHLTATHHRYQPVLETIAVSTASTDVALVEWLTDYDGELVPGLDNQLLSFTLSNSGSSSLSNLVISATLDESYGTVLADGLELFSLAPGAEYTFGSINVSPAGSLADGSILPLMLDISCDQGSFERAALVSMRAPLMGYTSFAFNGGILDPNETDTGRITFINNGSMTGTGITVQLTSLMPEFLTVDSFPISLGSLASGASLVGNASMTALPSANPGQTVLVQADWSSDGATITGSFAFPVSIGSPDTSDPTGPDAYGYWAYEDLDSAYPSAPVYNWYAITAPEGGIGTELLIEDSSEDDDSGAWVDLPFDFTYYGVTYSSAMICSNGFLSFAESGFGEFDFRNHVFPSAMGPDAMIAPMWDDHLTTGSDRGIWYWHDSVNHTFVVTWYALLGNTSGGPNTFQLVLYDPSIYTTESGDGPFLFQYETFNDTQSNYTDFDYCTIGFKDHTSLDGLTLLHWTEEAATMHPVSSGRAIYVTTTPGEFNDTIPPAITANSLPSPFAGEAFTLSVHISDFSGLALAEIFWRENGSAWTQTDLVSQGGGVYTLDFPAQAGGTMIEFYVHAVDASENANESTSQTWSFAISAASIIWSEDFNAGSDFTHVSGGGLTDEWHLESYNTYEGDGCWKFGGSGNVDYGNNAGGVLSSPVITIPEGGTDLAVQFRSWLDAESSGFYSDSCYDAGIVEWRLDGGSWEQVTPSNGYTHWLRSSSSLTAWFGYPIEVLSGDFNWRLENLDLPDGTTSLELRFSFGSDGGVTAEGWYLDDFRLAGVVPQLGVQPVEITNISLAGLNLYLSWTASPGASQYLLYESEDPYGTGWTLIQTLTGTSATVDRSGASKFYMVRASD
jgi:hypothetical protein